jgi:endonuclease/exonuclease/phosphatase family metal-dependent hydrolase
MLSRPTTAAHCYLKGLRFARPCQATTLSKSCFYDEKKGLTPNFATCEGTRPVASFNRTDFEVVSFNVLGSGITASLPCSNALPGGAPNPYSGPEYTPARVDQLLAFIERKMEKEAILCLQEFGHADRTNPKFLALLERHGYGQVSTSYGYSHNRGAPVIGYLGAIVLYPLAHFEMLEYDQIPYVLPDDADKKLAQHAFVVARLAHRRLATPVVVVSAHLPFGLKDKTLTVHGVVDRVNAFARGDPVLLCGDMNLDARTQPLFLAATKAAGYVDVLEALRPDLVTAVACYTNAPVPEHLAIDYVMARDLTLSPQAVDTAAILAAGATIPNPAHPSDHFHVEAVLSLRSSSDPAACSLQRKLQALTDMLLSQ